MTSKPHLHHGLILLTLGYDFLFGENGLKARGIITHCPKNEMNNPRYLPINHSYLMQEKKKIISDFGMGIISGTRINHASTEDNLIIYIAIEPDSTYSIYLLLDGAAFHVIATRTDITADELLPVAKSLFSWYKREYES
jgi:hypothetical protein